MTGIQKKIFLLSAIVLSIMIVIWVILTYYNQKTQEQYNQILQRYLQMNEATRLSQETVTLLNGYLQDPAEWKLNELQASKTKMMDSKVYIAELRNRENEFTLVNYMHMIDSLADATERSLMFLKQNNKEQSLVYFAEAAGISDYISETALTLIDKELNAYETFYRNIIYQSGELKKLGLWMLALISIALLLFAYWFSLSITRPIKKLTFAARELSRGRFDQAIRIRTNDEISFLAMTFDRMRVNINNLISEIQNKAQLEGELQESKLLLRESQLKSLQSQINPHFLFNTLDTVSKKAYLEGAEETSDLIADVAGLLRYNLKRLDRSVTLREELDMLLKYIDIQRARFTERLQFRYDVDERLLETRLPGMTMQPIIENAVIHAVEPFEDGGLIEVRVYGDEDRVIVEIEDQGDGIAEDKVAHILEGSEQGNTAGHSTGIGFSNVVRRLRLFFGREDVFHIESSPGKGTKVILRLPKTGRESEHV
ncbi:sensor histidine kinase [Paenibacillus tarimensis]